MAFKRPFKREKGSKYRNVKVEYDGIKFDSKRELNRWLFLKESEARGEIADLKRQVKFELIPAIRETYIKHLKTKDKECERTIQLPITYTSDYCYYKDGVYVVEDLKSSPNMAALDKVFLIKEKLFRWRYGFPIKRVYKPNEAI